MRQNEISFSQLVMACMFIATVVSVIILCKMGPHQQSLIKAKYQEINKKYNS